MQYFIIILLIYLNFLYHLDLDENSETITIEYYFHYYFNLFKDSWLNFLIQYDKY